MNYYKICVYIMDEYVALHHCFIRQSKGNVRDKTPDDVVFV